MKTEHFASTQAEARQQKYDGAVAKAFDCALAGYREHFPSSSGESAVGKEACFHCRIGGIANSRCAESNPSPVMSRRNDRIGVIGSRRQVVGNFAARSVI